MTEAEVEVIREAKKQKAKEAAARSKDAVMKEFYGRSEAKKAGGGGGAWGLLGSMANKNG